MHKMKKPKFLALLLSLAVVIVALSFTTVATEETNGQVSSTVSTLTSITHISTAKINTEYTIVATSTDGGTIDPSGEITVAKDEDQSFNATPSDGYTFEKFIVDGEDVTVENNTYIFEKVNASHTIEAVFAEIVESKTEPIKEGWRQIDGNWQYFKDYVFYTGWHSDIPGWENQWFYFDPEDGIMHTEWLDNDNKRYYLDPSTGVMKLKWIQVENKWYFLRPNWGGAMATSWQQLSWSGGVDWFYFDVPSGAMQTGLQNNIPGWEGRYFYFDYSTGVMQLGHFRLNGNDYETDANGCILGDVGLTLKGIDVSQWQGNNIDWQQVRNDGVEYVMIRSNYGWTGKDIYFDKNIQEAKAVGLKVGVYLYSYATTVEEAFWEFDNLMSTIEGYDIDFPIAYDLEDECQRSLSVQEMTDIAVTFCNLVRNEGYDPMIYASTSWMTTRLNYIAIEQFKLWVAQYNTTCTYAYRNPPNMWQYTSQGSVNGINGNVDMDWMYF